VKQDYPRFLASTAWLDRHLADPRVRVIDCTTHLPPKADFSLYDVVPGREDFERGRIPGAVFLDIEHDVSEPHPKLHFMLPTPEKFAEAMSRLGISDDTFAVCYSTANHWWATRLWWMLRVFGHDDAAVLDGGFQKWGLEDRKIESGPAKPPARGKFTARGTRRELIAYKADVLAAIGSARVCTVNALRPEQHAGTGGVHYGRRGHIAGSINIPAIHHIEPDNTFKGIDELRRMFAPALSCPLVITYCGGGIAATSVALVLAMLGQDNVKVYDASLTQWAADPTLPMTSHSTTSAGRADATPSAPPATR
jgi:thiosulfate/3-mercaptopyruvate sulfurtransferase